MPPPEGDKQDKHNSPEELEEISEDKIKQKYPGSKRPDYVYGTEDMGVNVCYSNTNNTLKLSGLSEYLQTTTSGIASQLGNENIAQSYMDTINTIPFAVIEFYSPTPNEGRVYNLLFTRSRGYEAWACAHGIRAH